jgi:hypothetical protein
MSVSLFNAVLHNLTNIYDTPISTMSLAFIVHTEANKGSVPMIPEIGKLPLADSSDWVSVLA